MGFIDSYKRLEKLCGEIFNDNRRVSAYIDEMQRVSSRGSFFVKNWDEDLKKLKQYRWVRNKISHEPGCTEQNMCHAEDALWLDEFHSRIMNQTDPLSLYRKATRPRPPVKQNVKPVHINTPSTDIKKSARNKIGCATLVIISLLVVAGIVLLTQFI